MRMELVLALGAVLMLAGCDQDDPAEGNQSGKVAGLAANQMVAPEAEDGMTINAATASRTDSAGGSERFTCDNGAGVVVTYGNGAAALLIDGEEYQLPNVSAASGSKYMSDTGMTKGKSLTWWSKGNGAMLIEAPVGDTSGTKDVVLQCKQAADAKAQPDIG
ncbi:MliC family protein [Sphingomonas sp. ERG5]|uniref:MliC family protein n=1 Tax=Sphingomonas sp. ERG5 TaxID=1381597 RepID=UPI0009DE134B|nr:MliC family protein [Sphingomonas sp. ERG5]